MRNLLVKITAITFIALAISATILPTRAFAADVATAEAAAEGTEMITNGEAEVTSSKAYAAGIAIGLAAAAGAIAMALTIKGSVESMAKQPEAEGSIRTTMMLGLVFVETAIIYALIVAILIIFVL